MPYSLNEATDLQRYNGSIGVLSSTTGNVYGIYDLVGGAAEYVADYYSGGNAAVLSEDVSLKEKAGAL